MTNDEVKIIQNLLKICKSYVFLSRELRCDFIDLNEGILNRRILSAADIKDDEVGFYIEETPYKILIADVPKIIKMKAFL